MLESLPPLPLASTRLLLVIQKNHQQIGLYTRIALRDLKVSYSDVGEGGVAVNTEHPVQLGQLEEQHHFVDNVDLEQMLSFIL